MPQNINWGLLGLGQQNFQNAGIQGERVGNALAQGFQARQQSQQAAEQRNALTQYIGNRTRDGAVGLAAFNPELAMSEVNRFDQQEAQQRQSGVEGMAQFRPLLEQAASGPEGYALARQAAIDSGQDVSRIPPQYNPEWVQRQMLIVDSLQDPARLTAIQQDIQAMGIDPTTPEGQEAVGELVVFKYGKETTDEYGRPSLTMPQIQVPGGQQPYNQQAPQGVPTGSPLSQLPPQQAPQQQAPLFEVGQWREYERAMGAAFVPTVERDKPVIQNSRGQQVSTDVLNGQVAYNVDGVWYDNPEGQ